MSEYTDLEIFLPDVLEFLGGGTDPYMQSFLLHLPPVLSAEECEDVRPRCINAILEQHPFLRKPFSDGAFDTFECRQRWFYRQSPDISYIWLTPIEQREGVVQIAGIGPMTYQA